MTPAKTGPAKSTEARHSRRSRAEKEIWASRKSASCFQAGRGRRPEATPIRAAVAPGRSANRRASAIIPLTVRSSERDPVSGRSP